MVNVVLNAPAVSVVICGVDRLPELPAWVSVIMLLEDAATLGGKPVPEMVMVPVRPLLGEIVTDRAETSMLALAVPPTLSVTVTCLTPGDVPAGTRIWSL
jgi:hypothetical protein